ncbi:MAG: hypothetical protein ACPGQS_12400, partial [Bradymonadia bacterium]
QLRRPTPKHSFKDLIKAVLVSGAIVALIVGLFSIDFGSKSIVEHLTPDKETTGTSKKKDAEQMDRYTESESEALDKLIKDKSK